MYISYLITHKRAIRPCHPSHYIRLVFLLSRGGINDTYYENVLSDATKRTHSLYTYSPYLSPACRNKPHRRCRRDVGNGRDLGGNREERNQERVGSVATDPDSLKNSEEVGREEQDNQGLSKN